MHPVLFSIGDFPVYAYGALAAAAMLTVFVMLPSRAERIGIPVPHAMDLLFLLFVAGIVGARLFYVLQNLEDYAANPMRVLSLREGGLVYYGGFIVSASSGLIYAHWRKWPLLRLCDLFSPLLALAHGIGRLGCFLNGCCWGKETSAQIGVVFPGETVARHPVQLYEAGALMLLALVLDRIWAKGTRREGAVFTAYLAGYSAIRFGLEFLRGDQTAHFGLTLAQWTSVVLMAGAFFLHFGVLRRRFR